MNATLNNIAGTLLIDATAAFLNGAGLGSGEDRNQVIPKTFREKVGGRIENTPYVSAQAWRRWLRNTSNEENNWNPSELHAIEVSTKGSTNKIATELNPIDFPEDDLFGYMKAGGKAKNAKEEDDESEDEEKKSKSKEKTESIQRTSPFRTSILKGIKELSALSTDEAFVHLKDGTPLPYSTRFYSTHLEGFFNLEYYRLGVYDNVGSRQELSKELIDKYNNQLEKSIISKKHERFTLINREVCRKERASGLLKGIAYLRGGAKQAAYGADVAPKVLIIAGLESANPIFNNLFIGQGSKPALNIDAIKQLVNDYESKLATPVYIGIRTGYLANEEDVKGLAQDGFIINSPIGIIEEFTKKHLS